MASGSPRVIKTARFEEEAKQLLESDRQGAVKSLVWALTRNPQFGQQVRGTNLQVWPLYRGDHVYLAYYSVAAGTITLESVVLRNTPIAPGPLGLEK